MGSDLHMTPPSPPEYVLLSADSILALYVIQTDGLFGSQETENYRLVYKEDLPAHESIALLVSKLRPDIRHERIIRGPKGGHPANALEQWIPKDRLQPSVEKRMKLAELESQVAELREELGL